MGKIIKNGITYTGSGGSGSSAVNSVNGETGDVVLDASDVGAVDASDYTDTSVKVVDTFTAGSVTNVEVVGDTLKVTLGSPAALSTQTKTTLIKNS